MSENNETAKPAQADEGKGTVGDILKRERLTRRITVETIAKDLKLNVGYIKALEASDYNALPVDPYVRVYIKSLAKYLSLNADNIMKQFYKERGLISEDEKSPSKKIDVSVSKQEKNPTIVVAAILIVVLAVFAFIAQQKGWLVQPGDTLPVEAVGGKTDSTATTDEESELNKIVDSLNDDQVAKANAPDTTPAVQPPPAPPQRKARPRAVPAETGSGE
jgi:cytoskeletal protein RodZ